MNRRILFASVVFFHLISLAGYSQAEPTPQSVRIGIDEKLGKQVALDVVFVGEDGSPVTLRQLVRTPTILALVYYNCPNVCDLLLTGIAGVLTGLSAEPGRDFTVIAVSIDDRETPADARRAKRIGLESIQKPFPQESWRFLTGSSASISAVADSIGFRFARRGAYFDHPVGITILSPSGRIVRYMNGADFLPADLDMSILEASQGVVRPTIAKFLRICFGYDPQSHKLVFRTLRVVAAVTITLAGAFILFLVLTGRKKRRPAGPAR